MTSFTDCAHFLKFIAFSFLTVSCKNRLPWLLALIVGSVSESDFVSNFFFVVIGSAI